MDWSTAWPGDLRFAWRGLRTAWGPAIAAVLVLALGSGLNTSVLAVTYGVLMRPLPYADPITAPRRPDRR